MGGYLLYVWVDGPQDTSRPGVQIGLYERMGIFKSVNNCKKWLNDNPEVYDAAVSKKGDHAHKIIAWETLVLVE